MKQDYITKVNRMFKQHQGLLLTQAGGSPNTGMTWPSSLTLWTHGRTSTTYSLRPGFIHQCGTVPITESALLPFCSTFQTPWHLWVSPGLLTLCSPQLGPIYTSHPFVFCSCYNYIFSLPTTANYSNISLQYLKNYSVKLTFMKKKLYISLIDYQFP